MSRHKTLAHRFRVYVMRIQYTCIVFIFLSHDLVSIKFLAAPSIALPQNVFVLNGRFTYSIERLLVNSMMWQLFWMPVYFIVIPIFHFAQNGPDFVVISGCLLLKLHVLQIWWNFSRIHTLIGHFRLLKRRLSMIKEWPTPIHLTGNLISRSIRFWFFF